MTHQGHNPLSKGPIMNKNAYAILPMAALS
jgi:hypothetical protein